MKMANSSPVAEVLDYLFEGQGDSNAQRWRVLSYRRDFDFLWGLGEHSKKAFLSEIGEGESILLVWDGLPAHGTEPTPVNVESRVTAFDWLTFLILDLAENPRRIRICCFRFVQQCACQLVWMPPVPVASAACPVDIRPQS